MSVAVKIVDEDGREVPRGECGEIVCRGPNVMKEYYNDPDATRAVLKDKWLCTGDRGKMDRDGYLFLRGRSKEVIISGGENIYPAEIETILHQHPLITEAAVIGVPDEYWGETVRAVVVPRPDKSISEQEVIDYCAANLARYKRPRSVVFAASLPRNVSGKVMKTELLKHLGDVVDKVE
jgi:acyl-CoA synthetase (AMP-forming)/AMP-acid ligase II